MNDTRAVPETLIEALEAEVARDVELMVADAEGRARAIVAQARRRNRRRFHLAAASLRRERSAALGNAHSQVARARHQAFLAENAAIAEEGLDRIEQSLGEAWANADTRALWCRNAIRLACTLLGDIERFTVEHPGDLHEDTRATILDEMGQVGCSAPRLRPEADLAIGLRLRSEHATVDASIGGLMRDRARIAGEYLALLGRGEEADHG